MLPGSLCHQWVYPWIATSVMRVILEKYVCLHEGWRRRIHMVRVLYVLLCIIPVCHAQALNKYLIVSVKPILFIKLS